MEVCRIDDLDVTINREGSCEFAKVSYPIRYGRYSEIRTPDYRFQFNLNGEIKFIRGLDKNWPDPLEWLKRTAGNDWVYYSTGGYSGVYDSFGEYYLPCPSYASNATYVNDPFENNAVGSAITAWTGLQARISQMAFGPFPRNIKDFLTLAGRNGPNVLATKARNLHELIGGNITVLPPDTRHVDYEVIPIIVADSCLYRCGFCRIKSHQDFSPRTREDIKKQIQNLKAFYGHDIKNYNSVFLGTHDALNAGHKLIMFAAEKAYEAFDLGQSNIKGANLFLFGSVDSLLNCDDSLFDSLNSLPLKTYINIGLESADKNTLDIIRKPITPFMVEQAFTRMLEVNRRYERIEITVNFLLGYHLPPGHLSSFIELTENRLDKPYSKGAIYFSPLVNSGSEQNRGIVRKFYKIKALSPLPTYIYLIQRL
ncbi:conserved hypothetical protein [uncultured Desulfobacterium sp.]|uniref:Radical SAM core domain-containing protein n=1 Tax=uncultured Desulfobacterium sp. TaxID=201089 RepID=A0A445MSC4_9BACT|nr:conserved hypothetical protein [uncultured Desulfobacterium sp.]